MLNDNVPRRDACVARTTPGRLLEGCGVVNVGGSCGSRAVRRVASPGVLLFNVAADFIDDEIDATLPDCFLIPELFLMITRAAPVVLHHAIVLLVYLLLNDILRQHLIIELQRLLIDQLVVKA